MVQPVTNRVDQVNFGDLQNRIVNQQVQSFSKYDPAPSDPRVIQQIYQSNNPGPSNSPSQVYQPKDYQYNQPNPAPYSNNPQQSSLQRASENFWNNQRNPNPVPTGGGVSQVRPAPTPTVSAGLGAGVGGALAGGLISGIGGAIINQLFPPNPKIPPANPPGVPSASPIAPGIQQPGQGSFIPTNEPPPANPFDPTATPLPGTNIPPGFDPGNRQPGAKPTSPNTDPFAPLPPGSINIPPTEQPINFTVVLSASGWSMVSVNSQPVKREWTNNNFLSPLEAFGIPLGFEVTSQQVPFGGFPYVRLTFYFNWINDKGEPQRHTFGAYDNNPNFQAVTSAYPVVNGEPYPIDPQAPTPSFNPPTVPPTWKPPQFVIAPTANPAALPIGNPNANPNLQIPIVPNVSPQAQQRLQQQLQQNNNQNQNQSNQNANNSQNLTNPSPVNRQWTFSTPLNVGSSAFNTTNTPTNRVQNVPNQNLIPLNSLNSNASPTQQFREQLEKQFDKEPKPNPASPELCSNQCVADLQNKANSNNELVPVTVNRFTFWNRITGRAQFTPEVVMVPRGMEQLATMMGNRTADIRSRFGLAELRAKFAQVMNILSTAATYHNAAMLSANAAQTVGEAVTNSVQTFAPMFGVDKEVAETFDLNEVLGNTINTTMENAIGKEAWNGTKTTWHKLNRIITTASNIIWTIRSIGDSSREVMEWTAENTGKIGNALKRFRVVGENAYSWMPERVTGQGKWERRMRRFVEGTERIEEAASSFSGAVSEVRNIGEEVAEVKEQKEAFDKAVKDAPFFNRPDNDATKNAASQANQASKSPTLEPSDRAKGDAE